MKTILFFPKPVTMQQALWVTVLYYVLNNAELRHGEVLIFVPVNLFILFKSSLRCPYTHRTMYLELIIIAYSIKKSLVPYLGNLRICISKNVFLFYSKKLYVLLVENLIQKYKVQDPPATLPPEKSKATGKDSWKPR